MDHRKTRLASISRDYKSGRIKREDLIKDRVKNWLIEDPGLKGEIIKNEIMSIDDFEELFKLSPEEHRANYEKGKYTIEDINKIKHKGELPAEECDRMIFQIITKQFQSGDMSIDDVKYDPNLSSNEKEQLIQAYHSEGIKRGKYSDEEVEKLIINNEIDIEQIRELDGDLAERLIPEPIIPNFNNWKILPVLENRTDIFVFGVANSGKTTMMSGILHYADNAGRSVLSTASDNAGGVVYYNTLVDAVQQKRLIASTAGDSIQYMACDFKDDNDSKHPLTFVEMSGEDFEKIGKTDELVIPDIMKANVHSNNYKILMLVIDYQEEKDRNKRASAKKQAIELKNALWAFRKAGIFEKTDAIMLVITKWDLCKAGQGTADDAAEFLNSAGYGGVIATCKEIEEEHDRLQFVIQTFSLGTFSGIYNKRYEYEPQDSKKIFNWLCKKSARLNVDSKKKKGKSIFKRFW